MVMVAGPDWSGTVRGSTGVRPSAEWLRPTGLTLALVVCSGFLLSCGGDDSGGSGSATTASTTVASTVPTSTPSTVPTSTPSAETTGAASVTPSDESTSTAPRKVEPADPSGYTTDENGGDLYGHLGFRSPTGNVWCDMSPDGWAACMIGEHSWEMPDDGTCELDFVSGFVQVGDDGVTQGYCGGDVPVIPGKVLPYGQSLSLGSVTCTSMESGVRCAFGRPSYAFALSREKLEIS